MRLSELQSLEKRLSNFVGEFSEVLGRSDRLPKCSHYLCGLLLDGERKSIEPMASRLPNGNAQALQQFVADSPWSYEEVQKKLLELMQRKLDVPASGSALILDDTSFPKQGRSSVGVARQYCGALGKVANCQSMVSWQLAEGSPRGLHLPLMSDLYLPKEWTEDPERLEKAHIPQEKWKFRKKWRIALDLLDQFRGQVPHEVILFDAGYGEIREFLGELDERKETFLGQIPGTHKFWPGDVRIRTDQPAVGRPRLHPGVIDPRETLLTAKQWGEKLLHRKKNWQTIYLPHQRKTKVKVAAIRVREKIRIAYRGVGPERWLLFECYGDGTIKYYLSSFPENTSVRRMIRLAHSEYKVEQGYQQLKEELGMDHYEGRFWVGLLHHVTLCYMAYDFLVWMQKEAFLKKMPQNGRQYSSHIAGHAA